LTVHLKRNIKPHYLKDMRSEKKKGGKKRREGGRGGQKATTGEGKPPLEKRGAEMDPEGFETPK